MNEIRKKKNDLLLYLIRDHNILDEETQVKLNLEIADLEDQLAKDHLNKLDSEGACVSLVSQASCYMKAKYYANALDTFKIILETTKNPNLKSWIKQEVERIEKLMQKEEANGIS